ncbi:MAG: PilT/PilU family type 4a pilus ATPase, partial [Nitrospirae bacterium]|nr:PilT/PilU family type 4a pilus ATPase [Nitrospirota bacterium]
MHAVQIGASDIHLSTGYPPLYRLHGTITPTAAPPLAAEKLHNLLYDLLDDEQRKKLERDKELDFAIQLGENARFRVNCFYNLRGEGAVFRIIPTKIKTFEQLQLPPILREISEKPRGLVLVTGPTGSGKSTTLAAMIDHLNTNYDHHILTIEDPIEFIHPPKRGVLNQRELGPNTKSFGAALKSALREDPDVILVGEMRDLETISLALTAAETGHLVFGTLHTQSAPKTCDRIIDVFPPDQQKLVRIMFAE